MNARTPVQDVATSFYSTPRMSREHRCLDRRCRSDANHRSVAVIQPDYRGSGPGRDVDDTYRLAVSAGAVSVEEPRNLPYGDRRAMVEDRWGNIWQIATLLPANFGPGEP
jgi:hypothetical protein